VSLEDFGARSWAALRDLTRNDHGEIACPACDAPIGHSRGDLEIPVARLEDDDLRAALQDDGVDHLRGRGYDSHCHDVLIPETVEGPKAMGYSSRMIGVRVDLGQDGTGWIPVSADDLEGVDNALESASVAGAVADGSGTASEPTDAQQEPESAVSADDNRPAVVEELGLPTEYPDGHPRWTYVGHVREDATTVNAGRSGPGGQFNLLTAEPGDPGWLGNPYLTEEAGGEWSREESVAAFTSALFRLLEEDSDLLEAVAGLRGEVLGCWCHTLEETGQEHADDCHADVIARVVDRAIVRASGGDQGGD